MTSETRRDPRVDHLITAENTALVVIDYQQVQVNSIASMDRPEMVRNMVALAKAAVAWGVPVIHSTVNVKTGLNKPPIHQVADVLSAFPTYDRTTINTWEDAEARAAIEAADRKKLLIAGLWTEACLTFPAIDALAAGYEVYVPVDAVGGTSSVAHETALRRIEQAGGKLISTVQFVCELQRDWLRAETVPDFLDIMIGLGGTAALQFDWDRAERAAK